MRSFGVMKHGRNLEDILVFGSLVGIMRESIQIVYSHGTKGGLGGCFGS
jgi:hypothetical protein